jgi:TolB-like protein/Tfp pilus assembly protein PilF
MIMVVLTLALGYFAFDKFVLTPERVAVREAEVVQETETRVRSGFYGDRSIAVLPFENLSSDQEQRYLGDGIAEEILNLLAHIRKLRVISRSSAFALRDENLDIPEIAERLNVAHILEGSVRKAGNRVRVTAQLIDARSDTHLWSQSYERELDDVFKIQDDIAADVVANLQIELLNALPRIRHIDPEVLALTAQASQLMQSRPEGVGGKMYTLLSRALEIDPDYIPALNLMGGAYWFLHGETDQTWEEMQRKIAATYERILELDPDSAYPDYYYAFMLAAENRLEESAVLYSIALEKDLTIPDYVRLAGDFGLHYGKLDAANRLLKYALAIDPLCHQCRRRYAESLMFAGDYATAQWEYERYLAGANEGWNDYTIVLLLQGMASKALAHIDSIDVGENEFDDYTARGIRAMTLYSLGDFAGADRAFEELIAMQVGDQRSLTFSVTRTAAWMGKNDLAFENLFAMAATQFQYLRRRTFSPIWRNLHDDPRWLEFREFNGMSAKRLDAIEFDPNLPE